MRISVLAVLSSTWCLACGPKSSTPTTVEPGATEPVAASTQTESELDAPDPEAGPEDELEDELEDEEAEEETEEDPEAVAAAEPEGPWKFKLHNLCKRSVKYGLAPLEGEVELEELDTIKAGAVKEIEAEPEIGVHLGEGDAHSAAATEINGGHVWISSSCKGVGSSNDPGADPAKIDAKLQERIKSMTKATE